MFSSSQIIVKFVKVKKAKDVCSALLTDLRTTGHYFPYGITQCYLPLDTSEHAPV